MGVPPTIVNPDFLIDPPSYGAGAGAAFAAGWGAVFVRDLRPASVGVGELLGSIASAPSLHVRVVGSFTLT